MVLIAVYGTLRKGHYNYHNFALDLRYVAKHLGTTTIKGYKLCEYGTLPYAVSTYDDNDEITVDVFDIQYTRTFWQINLMEQTAGYFTDIERIKLDKEEHDTIIWTITETQLPKTAKHIKSGDWNDNERTITEEEQNATTTKK